MAARSTRPGGIGPPAVGGGDEGFAPVFWTAFERSANPMMLVDLDRQIVAANEACAHLSGRPVVALVGMSFKGLLDDPADALDPASWHAQVLAGESVGSRRIRRPDGTTATVDFALRAATVDDRVVVLGVCIHASYEQDANDAHRPGPLTPREREIVHLIALGRVTREICDELHVAPDTVRTHVRNAMAKTGAKTRAQLIAIALSDGLLDG